MWTPGSPWGAVLLETNLRGTYDVIKIKFSSVSMIFVFIIFAQ